MTASNFLGTKTSVKRVSVSAPYWSIDSTDLGLGWKSFEWFGSFYPNEGNNWLFHEDLGWLYRKGETIDDTWFWSERWKWTWTSSQLYPYLSESDGNWMYYLKGTVNPVRFFDYGQSQWLFTK